MERQYEFRIKYKRPPDHLTNYHYYMAISAEQAIDFQLQAMEHHGWNIELVDLERKCPWSGEWVNEKHVLNKIDTKNNIKT